MLFNRMESGRASISDAVYMEVITGLHGTTMPNLLAAACQTMVGAITTYETGDMVTAALTAVPKVPQTVEPRVSPVSTTVVPTEEPTGFEHVLP